MFYTNNFNKLKMHMHWFQVKLARNFVTTLKYFVQHNSELLGMNYSVVKAKKLGKAQKYLRH